MNNDKPRFRFSLFFHFFLYSVLIGSFAGYVYYSETQNEIEMQARIDKAVKQQQEIDTMDEEVVYTQEHNCTEVIRSQGLFISKEDPEVLKAAMMPETQVKMVATPEHEEKDNVAVKTKDRVTCYDMYQGSYFVPNSCRDRIKKYVHKYKDAHHFEVTAVIDRMEFKTLRALGEHSEFHEKLFIDDEELKRLKKFTQAGLAKYRSMEAAWIIKASTKHKVKTYNANYQIVSDRGYKGVIIQAYE